jgi:hypothetical protein
MEREDEREWGGWWEGAHTFQLLCLLQQSVSLSLSLLLLRDLLSRLLIMVGTINCNTLFTAPANVAGEK